MEMLKDIVRAYYPLMIAGACMLFVIGVFFSGASNGGMGVFGNAGEIYNSMIDTENIGTNGLDYIGGAGAGAADVPVIKYASGVRITGEAVTFKSLLKVQLSNQTEVSGSTENGFAIYLVDIRNAEGNSEMLVMSAQDIEGVEEIPASFLYDKENDLLHLHKSGTYTVIVKIYGSSGASAVYQFKLPVEAGN